MSSSNVPPETVERLRSVVQDWGREVTGAQARLQEQIRAASMELSQIEELLTHRLSTGNGKDLRHEVEQLRRENESLRQALAEREARIQELAERIAAQSGA